MTDYDDSIAGFLHRLLDIFEKGAQNQNSPTRPDRTEHRDYGSKTNRDKGQSLFICKTKNCTYVHEDSEELENHIEEEHGVGSYQKVDAEMAETTVIGAGEEETSFQSEDDTGKDWQPANFPELSKEDRKAMVKDWFNEHCETAATVPYVCAKVFGKEDVENGDTAYSGTWEVLNELTEEGFLEVTKNGSWNVYYSEENQLRNLSEMVEE